MGATKAKNAPRKTTSRKRAVKAQTTDVLVVGILDRSGSMSSCRDAAIEGWNTYLADLQADEGGETFLTILGFDHEREVWADGQPVREVEPLTHLTYVPRGNTALYDSLAHGIALADKRLKDLGREDMKVLIVTVTDGRENASVEYRQRFVGDDGAERLKVLIGDYEAKGNYTFVWLSSDLSEPPQAAAAAVGISAANAAAMSKSRESTGATYAALSATTSSLRASSASSSQQAFADAGLGNDYSDEALKTGSSSKS